MTGIELIAQERQRQLDSENWTAEHDAQYVSGELADAAICYAICNRVGTIANDVFLTIWPWDLDWYKPKDRITNLKKAGALIAAEIDRIQNTKTENE